MAAGKPCIYHGDEFRDRDYHFSRRDYHYSGNEYDRHYREGESRHGREFGRWKEHGGRDGYNKHRQKDDGRKREERVDWRYSSLSRGKSGRESGEISSGSGSDGSVDYALEAIMPPRKKLKISPIVADREEKEENRKLKDAVVPIGSSLPIVAKYCHQSPKAPSPNEVQNFPKSNELTRSHEHSPTVNLPGGSSFVSPRGLSSSLDQEWNGSNDRETEQLGEFEQNLQVSRWADDDEDEILDEEMHRRGKDMPVSGSSANSSSSKSPESGEFTRGSSLGSESHVNELFKNDYVEVDKNDENKITFSDSDIDLDEEDDDLEIPELKGSQRDIDMLYGSRSVHEFERLNYVNHGTYGDVYRARDKRNGEVVALKKVKMEKEREGFPLTSLREINILMSLSHSAIVDVKEVVVEEDVKRGKSETYLVMEYMEHDLKGLMETMKHPFSQSEVKCLMLQLLEGVKYLHDNWVLHRDLKTSNLLFNNCGELKICDFGLSRQYGSPLKPYTPLVVTLWYRAPELLLGAKQYSTAIDMWSVGCIMAELIAKKPLFCGESELDQLNKIFGTLGTPSEADWPEFSKLPGWKIKFVRQKYNLLRQKFPPTSFTGSPFLSAAGLDLLNRLLSFDPEKRITAEDAVNHEWFREVPLPKAKEFMPTFPVQHAKARRLRLRRIMKNPDPLKEL